MSVIRQSPGITGRYRECSSDSGAGAIMPTATGVSHSTAHPVHDGRPTRYVAPLTTSVTSGIAAIESTRPGLSETKTQLLLFFAQGHHLANSGDALFTEPIYATDRGIAVDDLTDDPTPALTGEGPLNTVGYVLSRYGNLSPADLRTLVQASQPWQLAMKPGGGPRIEWAWLRDWFSRPDETEDTDDDRPTASMIAAFRAKYPQAGQGH